MKRTIANARAREAGDKQVVVARRKVVLLSMHRVSYEHTNATIPCSRDIARTHTEKPFQLNEGAELSMHPMLHAHLAFGAQDAFRFFGGHHLNCLCPDHAYGYRKERLPSHC